MLQLVFQRVLLSLFINRRQTCVAESNLALQCFIDMEGFTYTATSISNPPEWMMFL